MTDAKLIKASIESNKILREKLANAERRIAELEGEKESKKECRLIPLRIVKK